MKHFFITIIIIISVLVLMACNKNSNTEPKSLVTISGKVVKSCDDHTPVAGLEIYVSGDKSNLVGCNPKKISTITDTEGNFTIQYNPRKDICLGSDAHLSLSSDDERGFQHTLLGGIPNKKADDLKINDLIVHQRNTSLYLFKIKLNSNTYTENDTLYKFTSDMGLAKHLPYPAPFVDRQIIDTLWFKNRSGQRYNVLSSSNDLFIGYIKTSYGDTINLRANSESSYPCSKPNNVWIELP